MTASRIISAAAALACTVAFVGCGSESGESKATLSKQDQQQLTERTDQFQKSLQATVTGLTSCLKDSAKSGGIAGIAACVDQLLTNTATTAEELSTYAAGLKGKVKEKCGTQLQAMSAAVKEIGSALRTAGSAIGKGDTTGFQQAIGGLSASGGELQAAVTAIGTDCVG
ncbi:MAG: hypothetical protein WCO96_05840 [Actinomycetes bacterium]